MRVPAIVAGVALLVAACGGSKGNGAPSDTSKAMAAAATTPPAATPPGTGATHEIQMVMQGTNAYRFIPDTLTIKAGDNVVFKGVSGAGHDVAFFADSIPPGAATVLNAAIPDKPQDLATAIIGDGQSVSVSFAGAPAGIYKFYCIPHQAMGMHGQITVTP